MGASAVSRSFTRVPSVYHTKQYELLTAKDNDAVESGKVTIGLAESNDSLLLGLR